MKVSAVIVTRGDVDLSPVLESLPMEWQVLVWVNGKCLEFYPPGDRDPVHPVPEELSWPDLSVYGRYAAIEHAANELIYVQDDDVIVSDPQAIVDAWRVSMWGTDEHVVCNMPQEFRHDGYTDSALVGFGSAFHRDAPARAFRSFARHIGLRTSDVKNDLEWFNRCCDVVFTTLTPRVLVDVAKVDREFASDDNRMWKQADHYGERVRMLELARKARDQ